MFFFAGGELWRTDGTSSGTIALRNGFEDATPERELQGNFYFLNRFRRELWSSNGTATGTVLLKASEQSSIEILGTSEDFLFFRAFDAATGVEIYRTDGTQAGTQIVRDINPGVASSNPWNLAAIGNTVLFFADDGVQGIEPWKTDGTPGATQLLKDINPGPGDSGQTSFGTNVFSYNNRFYFAANTPEAGIEPWVSDGTETGTTLLKETITGPPHPAFILYKTQHEGALYFEVHHYPAVELWKTSGTTASTVKVSDIGDNEDYSNAYRAFKDQLHFYNYYSTQSALWRTDGTQGTTTNYFSYYTVSGSTLFFDALSDYLIFYGIHDGFPTPLFRTDGTREGTEELTRFNASAYQVYPRDMTKAGNYVFYADHDGLSDRGLGGFPWSEEDYYHLIQTDGETVKSMRTMFGISTIGTNNITDYNGQLIFTTHDNQSGSSANNPMRLWIYEPADPPNDSASFTLVDPSTDSDIRRVTEGATIVHPLQGPAPLNIRYNPITSPGSVVFRVNDVVVRTETAAPYSLGGDVDGDYSTWAASANPGTYKLTATPYSEAGGRGTPGESLTVTFKIKEWDGGEPEPGECTASGTIVREYWDNVSGNSVASIPVNTTPTYKTELTWFADPGNPDPVNGNIDTDYGARIRGYICPPTSGSYTFWIASNDNSELWLSTDDAPANKKRIAHVIGATLFRQWDKYPSQKSEPVNLTAGKRYYIEALHKQGAGTDNVAVGWQLPDGTLERPIPGNRLSRFDDGSGQFPTVNVTSPTDGQLYTAPADILFQADASDDEGVSKVEFHVSSSWGPLTKIGEDTTAPYSYLWEDAPSGVYHVIAYAMDADRNRTASHANNFTVQHDACTASGTITRDYWTNVSGDQVSHVPVNSPPTSSNELTIFEGPSNIGDRYATRIRGYICAPTTGDFNFWIASNDASELWLSTDDDPANKVLIAWVSGATNPREWTKFGSQKSAPIHLIVGHSYYIEALHKESIGTDHISVGWTLPGGTMERPIPGSRLSPFGNSSARMASDALTSADEKSLYSQISVYPNPARSGDAEFTISGFEGIADMVDTDVEVINMTGDVIFAEKITCGGDCSDYSITIDKVLPSGLYMVNMKTNGVQQSRRLLVK